MQYLFFELENETYALEANMVQEVVDYTTIRNVPKTNRSILGVTNIRGELVGVIDLKSRLELDNSGETKRRSFIIVNIDDGIQKSLMALLVDMVIEVNNLESTNILATPEFGTKIEHKYIKNIIHYNEKYINVLNLDNVLNLNELMKKEG